MATAERMIRGAGISSKEMSVEFPVELPEPVDLPGSLEVFRRPGDDLIDRWDGHRLLRTFPNESTFVPYRAVAGVADGLQRKLLVTISAEADGTIVEKMVARSFIAAGSHFRELADADPEIGRLNRLYPGVRPVLQHDLFMALVRSISAQQVNLRWAATTRSRLAKRFGDRHTLDGEVVYSLNPERLSVAAVSEVRELQFTTRKAEAIIGLAQQFASGGLSLHDLVNASDEEVISRLVRLKGIGLWSAEWILCRTLGRPRVVAGDLGVRKAVGRAYLEGAMPAEEDVRRLTAHWGESAALAQALVLHSYVAGDVRAASS